MFCYTAYRCRSAQVKVRGILSNASCVEEKEKWNNSYVAGGFVEDSFEEKDVFSCKLIIGLVLSLK